MNTPLKLLIKKCCLLKICKNSKTFRNEDSVYLFIPYVEESGERLIAYLQAPKEILIGLFSDKENYILDLLDFCELLHIEPQSYITEERLMEIEDFYCKCRESVGYYNSFLPAQFNTPQQQLAC